MNDITSKVLEKSLDLVVRKHAMHVSNIANDNVPQYKAKAMDFDARLQQALEEADNDQVPKKLQEAMAAHNIDSVTPDLYEDPYSPAKPNGNTVNAEKEHTEIAKNTIRYEAALQLLNKKFAMEKFVLSSGGKY